MMKHEVGERIKHIREALNLKQKEFARRLGISPPTLSELESGKSKPAFDVVTTLAEQFNVNLYYLAFGKGEMFANPILDFSVNLKEKDMAVKTEDIERFLEYFGKSRRMQYYILHQFEERMMSMKETIPKEAEEE